MRVYNSLFERLKNQNEVIPVIIASAQEKLYVKPSPIKWSIHDNITHLAKYQPVFLERMLSIVKKEEILFERYTADTDPEFYIWQKWDTNKLVETIKSDRKKIFNLITSLSEKDLNKIGIHKKFGRLNILQWTEFFLLHEAHHLFTIFQLANSTDNQ